MQSQSSFDYYCLNCRRLMETSSAPVISGPFICGHCGASMVLDAANRIALAQCCPARDIAPHIGTQVSNNLAGTTSDRSPLPHSGLART
jgi:hypothetical protein